MVRIGINGFGRIGRSVLRASLGNKDVEVTAVNDLTDAKTLAYLLKHDSLMGAFPGEVSYEEGAVIAGGRRITVTAEKDPANIPWKKLGVDIVIESTGRFTERDKAETHILSGGARKVIISAPAKGDDMTIVMGVNHTGYDPVKHRVVSNGSCTTNALAPLVKVLNDTFGVEHGVMMTTHAYTNSQSLHDEPGKELRTARAAALSIIPHSSGAAKAIGKVIPELDGRLNGYSVRVPVPVVSIVDLTVNLSKDATPEEINNAFRNAADGALKGILGVSDELLVSSDFQGDSRSTIVDAASTIVVGKRMAKIMSWYDNEWAFSVRLIDLAAYMASRGL
jgi:glyceraldehyde 3-phosphate dehydrogenase